MAARTTMGLRPKRSAMRPQTGAAAAWQVWLAATAAPLHNAMAPGLVTPTSRTMRGRNGNTKEAPARGPNMENQSTPSCAFHDGPGLAAAAGTGAGTGVTCRAKRAAPPNV